MSDTRGLFVISVAAELAGVHPQTLRIYERKGLIEPRRTEGGSRRYSQADLERLARILELTEEGLNLAGVKRVLELEGELHRLRAEMERIRDEALDAIDQTRRAHRHELVPTGGRSVVLYRQRFPSLPERD